MPGVVPTPASSEKMPHQVPFAQVAPFLKAALLLGTGGGFVFATILTLTRMLQIPIGPWWAGMAQAHGHLQLYGWVGLFVLGVAFHFLPRLRGAPLAAPWLVPWLLGALVMSLLLRAVSQPLMVVVGENTWRMLLITSGMLECGSLLGAMLVLAMTVWHGPSLATRSAFLGVLPFVLGAFVALGVTSCVNLVNVVLASAMGGLVPNNSDNLNVTLGLFGFLIPMALAMSAQSLPMYAGLEAFPRRILWPLAAIYLLGLILTCIGTAGDFQQTTSSALLGGLGMLLLGAVILIFVAVFLKMMRTRGRLPQRVAQLAPSPEAAARTYQQRVNTECNAYGPFVALVASAYMWAIVGGLLLVTDGVVMLFAGVPPFILDAIRHSLAVGFITLLICGIAPRMVPGFSGGKIASPKLVSATLWLGNLAALLRVGSLLLAPILVTLNFAGFSLYSVLFGLSGPAGLALAICLTVNLWPALRPGARTVA